MTRAEVHAVPVVPAPSDATELFDWVQRGSGLATRAFAGAVYESAGFTVRVEGVQRENGACARWVTLNRGDVPAWSGSPDDLMEAEAVRQLVAALSAAATAVECRR